MSAADLILYRVTDGWDLGDPPILWRYTVRRETRKCYIIDGDDIRGERRILKDQDGRRYAYATVEGAIKSFRRRKRRQIAISRHQIECAERSLELLPQMRDAITRTIVTVPA